MPQVPPSDGEQDHLDDSDKSPSCKDIFDQKEWVRLCTFEAGEARAKKKVKRGVSDKEEKTQDTAKLRSRTLQFREHPWSTALPPQRHGSCAMSN